MGPVFYIVQNINGDYAEMTSNAGVEKQVAMFLLPEGTDVGSRLKWENFERELLAYAYRRDGGCRPFVLVISNTAP